jgi:hypothetical protein
MNASVITSYFVSQTILHANERLSEKEVLELVFKRLQRINGGSLNEEVFKAKIKSALELAVEEELVIETSSWVFTYTHPDRDI